MSKVSKTKANLQTAVTMELAATHQYQLHAHVLEDWGLDVLASKMREEVQEEMGHSDRFIERLIFINGEPVLGMQQEIRPAANLSELFAADLSDEKGAIRFYSDAAIVAADEGDIGSRRLFEEIALDEEGHMAWLELQIDLMERLGESLYTARHISVGAN